MGSILSCLTPGASQLSLCSKTWKLGFSFLRCCCCLKQDVTAMAEVFLSTGIPNGCLASGALFKDMGQIERWASCWKRWKSHLESECFPSAIAKKDNVPEPESSLFQFFWVCDLNWEKCLSQPSWGHIQSSAVHVFPRFPCLLCALFEMKNKATCQSWWYVQTCNPHRFRKTSKWKLLGSDYILLQMVNLCPEPPTLLWLLYCMFGIDYTMEYFQINELHAIYPNKT